MRVSADHEAHASVEIVGQRLLLARRLRVDIDDGRIGDLGERTGFELPVEGREGIVERVHEEAAHHVDDQNATARMSVDEVGAAAGVPAG